MSALKRTRPHSREGTEALVAISNAVPIGRATVVMVGGMAPGTVVTSLRLLSLL